MKKNRYLHVAAYSNHFKSEIDDILNKTIEENILFVKKQVEIFSNIWFFVTFNDIIEYYRGLWKTRDSINSSSIVQFFYKWKYNKENKELISKLFWSKYDMYWFYYNVINEEWKFYPKYENDINNDWLNFLDLKNIFKDDVVLSIAHPNFTFNDNIIDFEKEIYWYLENWINSIEINVNSDKKWVESVLKISKKTDIIITFWSDCHRIWSNNKKHWDFWWMNSFMSDSIVKKNYSSFREKIWL